MRILITGATGLAGQGVLHECLADPAVEKVIALTRRSTGKTHDKLEELIVDDFSDLSPVEPRLHPLDACLYCAGAVPIGISEAEYRHVTLDLTLNVATTLARLNPNLIFVYISGAHSDPSSRIMVLRVKGEAERALAALPIRTVMMRTGGIQPVDGAHSPHPAMAAIYTVAAPLMGIGVRLTPALLTSTRHVGRAMLQLIRQASPPGVVENAEINRLGEEA